MANTARAEMPIEIGGRNYVLRFNAGFIRRMEEMYPTADGLPRQIGALFTTKTAVSVVLRAVWCALQPHEFERFPTMEVLEEVLEPEAIKVYAEAITKGVRKSLGIPDRPPVPATVPAPADGAGDVTPSLSGTGAASSEPQP